MRGDQREEVGRAGGGLAKDARVWLDHRRTVWLDHSVAQIGAPEAWAAGTAMGTPVDELYTARERDFHGHTARGRCGGDNRQRGPAGRDHTIGVSLRRTDGADVVRAGLGVAYSVDEGASWREAAVVNGRASIANPVSGFVWLRVEAWTASGERVVQTAQRAYAVV